MDEVEKNEIDLGDGNELQSKAAKFEMTGRRLGLPGKSLLCAGAGGRTCTQAQACARVFSTFEPEGGGSWCTATFTYCALWRSPLVTGLWSLDDSITSCFMTDTHTHTQDTPRHTDTNTHTRTIMLCHIVIIDRSFTLGNFRSPLLPSEASVCVCVCVGCVVNLRSFGGAFCSGTLLV